MSAWSRKRLRTDAASTSSLGDQWSAPLLEVARRAGHSVDTCERYYAKIFDDVDPANRVDPEDAIRLAREPGESGVARLFDVTEGAGS